MTKGKNMNFICAFMDLELFEKVKNILGETEHNVLGPAITNQIHLATLSFEDPLIILCPAKGESWIRNALLCKKYSITFSVTETQITPFTAQICTEQGVEIIHIDDLPSISL